MKSYHHRVSKGPDAQSTGSHQQRITEHSLFSIHKKVFQRNYNASLCGVKSYNNNNNKNSAYANYSSPLKDSLDFDYDSVFSVPVKVKPELASIPSSSSRRPMLPLLPPEVRDLYASAEGGLLREDAPSHKIRPAMMIEDPDYPLLIKRLNASKMMTFTESPKCVNGLFGILKDDGSHRLIIDARPANQCFIVPPKPNLPNPSLLTRLRLAKLRAKLKIHVGKTDISNFYHQLELPEWLTGYFALPAVRAGDVGALGFHPDTLVYPCCATLPMGWAHSVFIAQLIHERILDSIPALAKEHRITFSNDFFLDRMRHLVYIDDVAFFGAKNDVRNAMRAYMKICEDLGLPIKPSKTVWPTRDVVPVLGILFHGRTLTLAVDPLKTQLLKTETLALIERGEATGRLVASLVGAWSWGFLIKRSFFAIFQSVYRFIRVADLRTYSLWKTVKRELIWACSLAPLMSFTFDKPIFDRVIATDASTVAFGVVQSHISTQSTHTLMHSFFTRSRDTPSYPAPDMSLFTSWSTLFSAPWLYPAHINVLEMIALVLGVRWLVSRPRAFGHRVLFLCDSSACVGAVNKGRSSAFKLLQKLRPLTALLLAHDIALEVAWVPSKENPADAPSRAY